jgi:hypothetical protein
MLTDTDKNVNSDNTITQNNQSAVTPAADTDISNSGASGIEICTLLLQITSLALVAKNVLL